MRSYYSTHRWAPDFDPDRRGPEPDRPRKLPRRAVFLFCTLLAVILILLAALAAMALQRSLEQFPYTLPPGQETGAARSQNQPPDIPRAKTGDGTTLDLHTSSGQQELTAQEIYQQNIDTIVGIYTYGEEFSSTGTGIVLTSDGYLLTNAHVVAGGTQVLAVLFDGSYYQCELVGFDPYSDLAVLRIHPDQPLSAARFGDSDELQVGDPALALGNPMGTELWGTMTDGIISAINRDVTMTDGATMTLIQTTAAINTGNSGGALLDRYGQVVGVTNMKYMAQDNTIEGLGFAIPSTTAKTVADALIAHGEYLGAPSIGITGSASAAPAGVLIHSVEARSDAAAQGVLPGDVITAVNGQPVASVDDINALKEGLEVGDPLTLTLQRETETLTLTIRLVGAYSLN